MPRIAKTKRNLQAQAALAQSSRSSSTSQNITRPSTPALSSCSIPAVSPAPPDTPDILLDAEIDGEPETFEKIYLHLPGAGCRKQTSHRQIPETVAHAFD